MKKNILLILFLMLFYVSNISAEEPTGWMPKWNVGDWWTLKELRNVGEKIGVPEDWVGPINYKCTVQEVKSIDDREFFALEIINTDSDKDVKTISFYAKDNFQLLKSEFYNEGIKTGEEAYYNKYRQYPCPVVSPNMFSTPVFPIDIKQDKKQEFRIEHLDETYLQTIDTISENGCKSLIDSTIPKSSSKSKLTHKETKGKARIRTSTKINNVKNEIYSQSNILDFKNKCLRITLEKKSRSRFIKALNSFDYRTDKIIQIWNIDSPWPLYSETPRAKYYLVSFSR